MEAVWTILNWVVLPLWVFAGFLDYLCHRNARIEVATGERESAIHWLMISEVGLPILLAVFFKVNALILATAAILWVAHEITGYLDLRIAMATRQVTIFEHQVHSMLEVLPLAALLLLAVLHWDQAKALVGVGSTVADFGLRMKEFPKLVEIGPPGLTFVILTVLPYAEEFIRGFKRRGA
jgi:hypothetical protein